MEGYIFTPEENASFIGAQTAIIMLPDIYGQTEYSKATAGEFAKAFQRPVYMLDYFYGLSGKPTVASPENKEVVFGLMSRMRGEDFVDIFQKALAEIMQAQPAITQLAVIGFCFGGRLAYLAAMEPKVTKLVSFYGAGANTPDYYDSQTPLQALIAHRSGTRLQILTFFGGQDESISVEERTRTEQELTVAGFSYQSKVYDVGHAYFQAGRPGYNVPASKASLEDLVAFMGQ